MGEGGREGGREGEKGGYIRTQTQFILTSLGHIQGVRALKSPNSVCVVDKHVHLRM